LDNISQAIDQLVAMSRHLGEPQRDYVILGEGNTSARADEETFWVKASGAQLCNIDAQGFVRVRFGPVLALLDAGDVTEEDVKHTLAEATVGDTKLRPSTEAFMHALLLQLQDVHFVGHTHPTAVNAILCARHPKPVLRGRLFPDEIVCCGVAPVWVPFVPPGVALARRIRQNVEAFIARYGERPRSILLQNHGLIALGATPAEVQNTTAMWVKTARILAGTFQFGGPHYLTATQVQEIHTRADEKYRKSLLDGTRERGEPDAGTTP